MQLPEQLGDVNHIFCDKTGTLTQNELEVKAVNVGGIELMAETSQELSKKIRDDCDQDSLKQLFTLFCLCNEVTPMSSGATP